jgi:hypothetical protein
MSMVVILPVLMRYRKVPLISLLEKCISTSDLISSEGV